MASSRPPAAFLFDLDGTLIDSESVWVRAIADWIRDATGETADGRDFSEHVFGHSWPDIYAYLHATYPKLPPSAIGDDARELRRRYDLMGVTPAKIAIASSCRFFLACAAIAPCCIVSGSPRQAVLEFAEACGLAGSLAFALGPEDYARGKPAPDGYLEAARRLRAEPADCVVFEDSTPGVASARQAGMRVVGLRRPGAARADYTGCERVVADLSEIDPRSL